MTTYRDKLKEEVDGDLAFVVGCGLDRLERFVSNAEIQRAIDFYYAYKEEINYFPINARRQAICDYIQDGKVPSYILNRRSKTPV
ncbi:hypothetical protein [Photobacterium damselae]|uniref:Uncharacterized protein n=1 Tax=Photobacterium damselae TaxID=38293 RepID=A0A2T3QCY3_PHODM|nr:hypothetical protein [Photobacterium damselae]KAB1512025.1 hypothetical protein FD717_010605 [Photobacterium damselae subsp. damselae]PSW82029.1 hypothetical protein CTN07_18220 [Photobacterium damselae]TLS72169.1 hypothetical protein FD718_03305 [Photobacterium damselae subsp. damselae]TLS80249.1 hypothetical protein FD721_01605 [Photobacterium damselae subsp. damselae]TLS82914.1 hypothetical protein FD720_21165 [Photobacterium damselae subsp. damselae]